MTNGETVKVRVRAIDEEYDNLIVDVLETSTPEHPLDRSAAYITAASHIESAELTQ
jgi:hypothetical protein